MNKPQSIEEILDNCIEQDWGWDGEDEYPTEEFDIDKAKAAIMADTPKRHVKIKVEKLSGWDTVPYWWVVESANPYEHKSAAALTKRGAIWKAKRVAKKMLKAKKPDITVFEEESDE